MFSLRQLCDPRALGRLSVLLAVASSSAIPVRAQSAYDLRFVMKERDEAPGTGGATFASIPVHLSLDQNGAPVFWSDLAPFSGDGAFWLEEADSLHLLARRFEPLGNLPIELSTSGTPNPPIRGRAGALTMVQNLSGPTVTAENDLAVLLWREGAWSILGREGTTAPGIPDATIRGTTAITAPSDAGTVATGYWLRDGDDEAITDWAVVLTGPGPSEARVLARGGDPMPGLGNAVFITPEAGQMSSQGIATVTAVGSTNGSATDVYALYRWRPDTEQLELVESESRTVNHAINATGDVAIALGSPVPSQTESSIAVVESSTLRRTVAATGDPAPGAGGATFDDLRLGVAISDGGLVAFMATLSDGRQGIWAETRDSLQPVIVTGGAAPARPDLMLASIDNFSANPGGAVAFRARLTGPGVFPGTNDVALYSGGVDGVSLVAREGDPLVLPSGRESTILNVYEAAPIGPNGDLLFVVAYDRPSQRALIHASRSIIVNVTSDDADLDPDDGVCNTGAAEVEGKPACSLRAALQEANSRSGRDNIRFQIPGSEAQVITPTSALPVVEDPVAVEGPLEAGFPAIRIHGADAGDTDGLVLTFDARGSTIRKLAVTGFERAGILLDETLEVTIAGCLIGTDGTGASDFGNGGPGILIRESPLNQIGGLAPGEGNVISGNSASGVEIVGDGSASNFLEGNRIGTTPDGNAPLPNAEHGVYMGDGARENFVLENLISGNEGNGVQISGDANERSEDNGIFGNYIGTNAAGTDAVPNQGHGVVVDGALTTDVGGTSDVADGGNVISGNASSGVYITGALTAGTRVAGNRIGTNADGEASLPNHEHGVHISNAPRTFVGGLSNTPGTMPGNVISGNARSGVFIEGSGASETRIEGNLIGTNSGGTAPVPNGENGVYVLAAPGTCIGCEVEAASNVISGNIGSGVRLQGIGPHGPLTQVARNYVGTSISGTEAIGNSTGILLIDCYGIIVGRLFGSGSDGNVISGNRNAGLRLVASHHTDINKNYIGVDVTGQLAVGNGGAGVSMVRASMENVVSYSVISGNLRGVEILNASDHNRILFATIGSQRRDELERPSTSSLLDLNNEQVGVLIENSRFVDVVRSVISHGLFGIQATQSSVDVSTTHHFYQNLIAKNVTGILLKNTRGDRVVGNRITLNESAIVGMDDESTFFDFNIIRDNTGDGTGIHRYGGSAVVQYNEISGDAGDAITLVDGAEAVVVDNNLFDNAGSGLRSSSAGVLISAANNWWGADSGPSGVGPGTGEEVSAGVDFTGWRTEPVGFVAEAERDTVRISAGTTDTVRILMRDFDNPSGEVDVSIADDRGWVSGPASFSVPLQPDLATEVAIPVAVPAGADGQESHVTVTSTRSDGTSDEVTSTAVVLAYTSTFVDLRLSPDTLRLEPGAVRPIAAYAVDQMGQLYTVMPTWTATGGTIDAEGQFTAGSTVGTFEVLASYDGGLKATAVIQIVMLTDVDKASPTPTDFALHPNYPNPFGERTHVPFDVAESARVRISLFDLLGRRVRMLADRAYAPGRHELVIEGEGLGSGIYFVVIEAGAFRETRKIARVRR